MLRSRVDRKTLEGLLRVGKSRTALFLRLCPTMYLANGFNIGDAPPLSSCPLFWKSDPNCSHGAAMASPVTCKIFFSAPAAKQAAEKTGTASTAAIPVSTRFGADPFLDKSVVGEPPRVNHLG
jgi:hypothetical protein